ncbi:RLA class II histocompatibility antigen, DP alpha-1 chain-like [Betta splendens]|uniref:RLA class II histocompatibility antigen, DP alpha-1 chain-like n=1 Tax=Betta splendens TaxID=158456 RepID=A0A8M1HBC9_BETSP|nr:RLA class II histocompatibility antigen, DP alpha-1 chain-like [Betta splendens]
MMMMKMKLVLVVLCVLCVSAEVLHEDFNIVGCSKTGNGEVMYALDGEEKWYADFNQQKGVEPQPSFIDHMSYVEGAYEQAVANVQICKTNLDIVSKAYNNTRLELVVFPTDPPSGPVVYTKDEVEPGVKNTLICFVTGFYPAPVKVHWTKNGDKVTEGTSINVPYLNKDSTFQQISRLEFTPQQGDMYSCSVEHPALEEPLTRLWDVQVQQPSVGPAVFCGLGLTIGLLGVAAGTFFLIKGNECS